jgi:hypothetical protein
VNSLFLSHNQYYRWFHDEFATNAQNQPCKDILDNTSGAWRNASDFWGNGEYQDSVYAFGDAAHYLSEAFPEEACNLNAGVALVDAFRKNGKPVFDDCHGINLEQSRAVIARLDEGWLVVKDGQLTPLSNEDAAVGLWILLHAAKWANNHVTISTETPLTIPFANSKTLNKNIGLKQDDGDAPELPDLPDEVPDVEIPNPPEDLPDVDTGDAIDDGQDAADDAAAEAEDVVDDGNEIVDENQDDAEAIIDDNKDDAEAIYDDNLDTIEDGAASANNEWAILRDQINAGKIDFSDPNWFNNLLASFGITL